MNLIYYGRGPASSAPRQSSQNSGKRRIPVQAWDRIRDQINREHRMIMLADPRSPRVRPSLAPIGWGLR